MLVNSGELGGDFLKVKKSLLRKFPMFTMHTTFRDAHFYIFSKFTLDILEEHKATLKSIKSHLIPFLARCQYRPKLVTTPVPTFLDPQVFKMTSLPYDQTDKIRCYAYKLPNSTYCDRVSDFPSFMAVNREIASGSRAYRPFEPPGPTPKALNFISASAVILGKTQIPANAIIGSSTIGDRVGVKKSIIGNHCHIGDNAKVMNSVVLDNVTIEFEAKIQSSIIGDNTFIGTGADITDCQIGASCKVAAGAILKGRKIGSNSNVN